MTDPQLLWGTTAPANWEPARQTAQQIIYNPSNYKTTEVAEQIFQACFDRWGWDGCRTIFGRCFRESRLGQFKPLLEAVAAQCSNEGEVFQIFQDIQRALDTHFGGDHMPTVPPSTNREVSSALAL